MNEYDRPIPVPDELTMEFWAAAREHRLAFQRCKHCQTYAHPPVLFCKGCGELENPSFEFVPVSGRARIVNWTVMHDSMVKGFKPPWVIVLVEFPEQRHLFYVSILEDTDSPKLKIGADVEVIFRDISEEMSLPCCKLL
jgi:uncharacterized OB-fold protein